MRIVIESDPSGGIRVSEGAATGAAMGEAAVGEALDGGGPSEALLGALGDPMSQTEVLDQEAFEDSLEPGGLGAHEAEGEEIRQSEMRRDRRAGEMEDSRGDLQTMQIDGVDAGEAPSWLVEVVEGSKGDAPMDDEPIQDN